MPSQEFRENIQVTCCGMIMVKANFDRVLQQLHRRAPFRPFVVELLKGDQRAIFTASSKASQAADYLRAFSDRIDDEEHEVL